MGNAASAANAGVPDDTAEAGAPPSELTSRSARLYLYDAAACKWNVERALVDVDFADDAAEGDAPSWHVEVRNPGRALALRCATPGRPAAPPGAACDDGP